MARAFTHIAGCVVWDSKRVLDQRQIDRLVQLLADDAMAAARVGAVAHYQAATELHIELAFAASDAARWRSVAGIPPQPARRAFTEA